MRTILFSLLLLLTVTVNTQNTTKTTFEVYELKADVEFFFSELEKTHPNLYYYYPKDSVLQAKEIIMRQLVVPMSRNDFAKLIELNTNHLFDGHTGMKWYFGWAGQKTIPDTAFLFPPKKISVERGDLYVGENASKILSINGIPSSEIIATMRNILEAGKHNYIKDCTIEDNFSTYYCLLFGSSKQFELTVEQNGKTTQTKLQGVAKKDIHDGNNIAPHFDLIIKNNIALLTVNTFDGKLFKEFQTFLDSYIMQIQRENVKYLFIDVSENSGGSDNNVSLLLDHLYPADYYFLYGYSTEQGNETSGYEWVRHNKVASPYLGKLFILQSYKTFSASMDFSSAIKTSNRGIVIGEMTGDPAYSFSNIKESKTMPNTKLSFVCASGFYAMPSGSHNCNVGILPDVYCHRKDLNTLKKDKNTLFEFFETIISKYGDRQNAIEILKIFE